MAMPNPFQKLKHGVLLCKKNFNTFVETFNFLVDFAQNLRGDGDANANGSIVVDRSVPDRPVIRSKINMDYPFGGEVADVPWTFSCTIDPDTQQRSGGWTNGRAQIGVDCGWGTPDVDPIKTISGSGETGDGYHYLQATYSSGGWNLSIILSASIKPDYESGSRSVHVLLGIVENGELTSASHMNPVIYNYL